METQNVTLSLPKELIRKAKVLAARRQTSISALLAGLLHELVATDADYDDARRRQLRQMQDPPNLGTKGRATWKRDELHER